MRSAVLAIAVLATACDAPPRRAAGSRDGGTSVAADAASTVDAGAAADAGAVDAGARPDAGASLDAAVDPAEEPADLGRRCFGGCNLSTCVLEDASCAGGVCVWDGPRAAAYCSRLCVRSCRDGYHCATTDDGEGPVCLSDPPVCGNGALEYGEVCDDGNTAAGDLCSATCDMVTVPPSGGTVRQSFHGNPPTTAMGDDPVVRAIRQNGILFFEADISGVTYGLRLPDGAGPAPYEALLEVGLTETVGTNLCPYQGSTRASITRLDFSARQIAGSAALVMVCTGGNCEFGCNRQFTHAVEFDLRWNDE